MGDIFFNGSYPYVDVEGGGSWKGLIVAVQSTLNNIDDNTKVIPGHGSLTDKEGLKIYYNVLKDIEGILTPLARSGLSLNDVKKLKPLEKYDGDYGKGFMDPNSFISIVYEDIYRNINQ